MKAVAVVGRDRTPTLVDVREPAMSAPDDVLIRVLDVGVCGTDQDILRGAHGAFPAREDRLILGHEAVGVVAAVGDGVDDLRVGDVVVPSVRRPCPHARCAPCRAGRPDYCATGDYQERGILRAHGFLAERVVERAAFLHVVPAAVRDVAVLVEPLTIVEKALAQVDVVQARLPPPARRPSDPRALVVGAGAVGILGAAALALRGYEVVVVARGPTGTPRARLVAAFGARYASSRETKLDALGSFDVVYEAAGSSSTAFAAMGRLAPNGVFVFAGVPGGDASTDVATDALVRRVVLGNQVLLGTVNAGGDDFARAVDDLATMQARAPAALSSLIERRALADFGDALARRGEAVKDAVRVDAPPDSPAPAPG